MYKSPIFSRVFTNLKSFISKVCRFGLHYTLVDRRFNIVSYKINVQKFFFDRSIKQFFQKLYVTKAIQDTE